MHDFNPSEKVLTMNGAGAEPKGEREFRPIKSVS
jgi:hypothetical protein